MSRTPGAVHMSLRPSAILLIMFGCVQVHLPATSARLHPVHAQRYGVNRQLSRENISDITVTDPGSTTQDAGSAAVDRTLTVRHAAAVSSSGDAATQESVGITSTSDDLYAGENPESICVGVHIAHIQHSMYQIGASIGNANFEEILWQALPGQVQNLKLCTHDSALLAAAGLLSYDLDHLPDLLALLQAHQDAQMAALLEAKGHSVPRAIKVETRDNVGLGNRIPSIVTGFVMALFTGRAFLLDSSILQHVQLPMAAEWNRFAASYQQASRCSIDNITSLVASNESLFGEQLALHDAILVVYHSIDYDMPFLQVNSAQQPHFNRYFPDGEVFHKIASYLFSNTTPVVQNVLEPYLPRAQDCLVGLHLRTKKHAEVQPVQFAGIARALAQSQAGNIFVAADQMDVFAAMETLLPSRDVWWSNLTYGSVATSTTAGGNPGTEISATVDLLLLSKCRHIVVTPSSSFGAVAAGLAGVAPVYATYGTHHHPFLNTWLWKSVTSEPCCFKLSKSHNLHDRLTGVVKQAHPLYYFHNQCHH